MVGLNTGIASNSYATGSVTGASGKSSPAGSGTEIGGLIGDNQRTALSSYATGAVSGTSQLGGLVGRNEMSGYVGQSYATGAVGAPSGQASQVGGLAGYNDATITEAYASGAVSGASGKGGFVGANSGSLSKDVFDEGATGTTLAVGFGPSTGVTAIGGSTGLSPYQASSYAGFDFAYTWTIQAGFSRPYLYYVPQSPPPT